MMVRLIKPQESMEIYDPCCGSGGMLIFSKRYVEEHGGDGRNLFLHGQDSSGSAWVVCKMNMLLHGISEKAEVYNDDTLLHPRHLDRGELRRFDRVISNPPFGMNYSRQDMDLKDRFRYGFCPETGKKAELMFIQHMWAVLRPNGILATVAPHGVLFRGGKEGEIRKGFINDDLIEAVIGLGPNLFYGTQIPACILVMRQHTGAKPKERQGKILFINADVDYEAGRAQNFLRAEHAEKVVRTFNDFATVPGYSRVVDVDEVREKDYNLNIRRYADNAPPPEPHDVRAHLVGGVPKAEVKDQNALLSSHGLSPNVLFIDRDDRYYDFAPTITKRATIETLVEADAGVRKCEERLGEAFAGWWAEHKGRLVALPGSNNLSSVRRDYLASFEEGLVPVGLLDRYKIAGVIATWWYQAFDELKTIAAQGFSGLIDGWIETIKDFVEVEEDDKDDDFNPFEHKIVARLAPEYLDELSTAELEIEKLKAEKDAFERGEHLEDSDEEYDGDERNYAKELEEERRALRAQIREPLYRIRQLSRGANVKDKGSIKAQEKLGNDTTALREELARLQAEVSPVLRDIEELDELLAPYAAVKKQLTAARRKLKQLRTELVKRLREARAKLTAEDDHRLVLDMVRSDISDYLERYLMQHRQQVVATVENWWGKYATSAEAIEQDRETSARQLSMMVKGLGYDP